MQWNLGLHVEWKQHTFPLMFETFLNFYVCLYRYWFFPQPMWTCKLCTPCWHPFLVVKLWRSEHTVNIVPLMVEQCLPCPRHCYSHCAREHCMVGNISHRSKHAHIHSFLSRAPSPRKHTLSLCTPQQSVVLWWILSRQIHKDQRRNNRTPPLNLY